MKNLTTFSQLQEQFQVNDFVQKTISQINKDLTGLIDELLIVNIDDSNTILDDVIAKLVPLVMQLSEGSLLQQFIYQIDLKEKKWIAFLTCKDYKLLAEQIIIREAQKVYLKEMFKNY